MRVRGGSRMSGKGVQIQVKACGRVVVACPGSVVIPGFSGFLHHA